MRSPIKYLRLLPAVVLVGAGLLAIKGIDFARAAPDPYAEPDNSGLAPRVSVPAAPDFASDSAMPATAAEADVTSSLARRRAELDTRERGLNMRENVLTAGEARVDQKIAALKQMQAEMQALLTQRDAKQDQQIASLVKTYSAMKPKDAARIFNSLNDEVLLPVAKGMKSDVLAPVMAAMIPEAAQRLTVHLAALLKLPEAPSVCPNSIGLLPGTQAAATPLPPDANPVVTTDVPLQTAALASPPSVTPVAPVTPAVATTAPAATPASAPTTEPPAKPHSVATHHAPPAKPVATATPAKPAPLLAPAKPPVSAKTAAAAPTTTAAATPPAPGATSAAVIAPPTPAAALPVVSTPTVASPSAPIVVPPTKPVTQAANAPPLPAPAQAHN